MKKYKLILADPPWSYSNKGVNGAADKHYQTMTPAQIKMLPLERVIDDDCVLLLWSTNPMLDVALDVIRNWGFSYVTSFPWIKFTGDGTVDKEGNINKNLSWGTGFWVRGCSEQILVSRRGNSRFPEQDFLGILGDRLKHSKKPDTIYEYAESFPGPYLELFARSSRNGWDVWGDEVESDIDLLKDIEQKHIDSEFIQAKVAEIKQAWLAEQNAKWIIGDAVADLIHSGMGKVDAYRLAQSQMPDMKSFYQPRLFYKISITYPKRERKIGKKSWNEYREDYIRVNRKLTERKREQRKKAYGLRKEIDRKLDS